MDKIKNIVSFRGSGYNKNIVDSIGKTDKIKIIINFYFNFLIHMSLFLFL